MDAWNFIIVIAALVVREGNAVKPNYCLPYQPKQYFLFESALFKLLFVQPLLLLKMPNAAKDKTKQFLTGE